MVRLSWPYNDQPQEAFWGPQSSHANFCEQDYILTSYVAEFINTLTNLTYLYYAYKGIQANANRADALTRNLPYLGISLVGFGSMVFHSTLKNWTQWCDELSMHIATATVLHRVCTFDKSLQFTISSGVISVIAMAIFIAWHCITDELIGHSVLFGVMIVLVGAKTRSIINSRVSSPSVQKDLKKLVVYGGLSFITGFGLWILDQVLCGPLTTLKRAIGMPWSFVLELHGWWHIFTGIGAYIFIALVEYLTSEQAGEELGASFAWPVGAILQKDLGSSTTEGTGSVKINVVEEVVAERQSLHSVAERQPLLIASGGRKQL